MPDEYQTLKEITGDADFDRGVYVVKTRGIKPARRAGHVRLFDAEAAQRIRQEVARLRQMQRAAGGVIAGLSDDPNELRKVSQRLVGSVIGKADLEALQRAADGEGIVQPRRGSR